MKDDLREPGLEKLQVAYTETERVILERRSVRKYKQKQVPDWMVKRILECGRFAPTAGNGQPWKFVVVRDQQVIQEMTDDVVTISRKLHRAVDYREPGRGWLRPLTNLFVRLQKNDMNPVPFGALKFLAEKKIDLYWGAPTVVLMFKDVRGIANPDIDCGIAGQNMVIASHSMGLGTCWVSFAKLLFQKTKRWQRFFEIDYPYKFVSSLAIGWPFAHPDGLVRRPVHPVDWYEAGQKSTLSAQGSTETIGRLERFAIPRYDDPRQISPGTVSIDAGKCTVCGICAEICPANALEKREGRLQMVEKQECIYCGACMAICPAAAIDLDRPLQHTKMFKTLGQGTPQRPRTGEEW